jgi:excisionase family DNA binding protein
MIAFSDTPETLTPTPADSELAKVSGRALARLAGKGGSAVSLKVKADDAPEETVAIPASAFKLLTYILSQMAMGNAMTLIPIHAELTTQQAAEILNVSRPFVIKLINEKVLPVKMVGKHRRILFSDLMQYKKTVDSKRLETLAELAKEAQELKLGY